MTGPSEHPNEAPRDQASSGFTPILRRLLGTSPAVLAVTFVDDEGECVDYCSALPPYDAKVIGAHMLVVLAEIDTPTERATRGVVRLLHLVGDRREILVRRVGDDHVLTVTVTEGGAVRRVLEAIEHTVVALRREAGLRAPAWDPVDPGLTVELRPAVGWPYAPVAFTEAGKRVVVADVLGRWIEGAPDTGGEIVCFRVRAEGGQELTLAHDPVTGRWIRR